MVVRFGGISGINGDGNTGVGTDLRPATSGDPDAPSSETSPSRGTPGWAAEPGESLARRRLMVEVLCVLGVSLGASALFAVIRYVGVVTADASVRSQVARLNTSAAPGRPWLDLALQVASLLTAVVPVLLALHLLGRYGGGPGALGLGATTARSFRRDVYTGALLAATVGGAGIGFYLLAWRSGANLTVAPSNLPDVWWRIPVLIASAVQNGLVEEVLVVGYLLVRLRQIGWGEGGALVASAFLRGLYHLYQGLGGFAGNMIMGLLFGWIFQRSGRVLPLVVAHILIDAVAFVGYVLLMGNVSWLPQG